MQANKKTTVSEVISASTPKTPGFHARVEIHLTNHQIQTVRFCYCSRQTEAMRDPILISTWNMQPRPTKQEIAAQLRDTAEAFQAAAAALDAYEEVA